MERTEWLDFSHIQRNQPAPSFRLNSSRGGTVALSDDRGRKNLVLVFLPGLDGPGCRAALQNFADRYREYQAGAAQVLVVVSSPAAQRALEEGAAYPFPVLADLEGDVRRAYTALLPVPVGDDQPVVFILDRYRAPYVAWTGPEPDDPALQDEFLDWLDFMEFQCPECGAPEWP